MRRKHLAAALVLLASGVLYGGQAPGRVKLLKKHIEKFTLIVRYYGPKDKGRYSLTLRVPVIKDKRLQFWPAAQLSKAQAEKIIDHLDRTGILAAAGNLHNKGFEPPKGPTYALTVTGPNELLLYEPLGWDSKMLERLDALRKVLDGDAAKAMDKLLKALEPQRKKWQKPAGGKPANRQAEVRADFQRLFRPADRRRILATTGEQALEIVKSEKDFRRLFEVYYWCKLHRGAIASDLVALLTKSREVGLTGSADLIIWERIKSGHLTFHGHGWVVEDDLFTVAGRASWLLKAMTGRDLGPVRMNSTAEDLAALSAQWRTIEVLNTRATKRRRLLEKNVDDFALRLRYHGPGKVAFPMLVLSVRPPQGQALAAQITKTEASAVLCHLSSDGFLGAAANIENKKIAYPKGPAQTMTVTGHGVLYQDLGWGLKMLRRLDGLRKVLTGQAAKAMDKLLKALEPQRKKWQAPPQRGVERRQACLAALREIRKGIPAVARKHPKGFDHLGPGELDEEKLFLRFPAKYLPKATPAVQPAAVRTRPRMLRPKDCGLSFRFIVPMSSKANAGQWLHVNVGLVLWWKWPNRGFSTEMYNDLQALVRWAVMPLDTLEDAAVAAPRGKGPYVLRGRPGVELTIRRSPKRSAFGTDVDLYVTNQTKGVVALCPAILQTIRDGKPRHHHVHSSLWLGMTAVLDGRKDPFTYIEPGRSTKIKSWVVGLSPGRHTVRIATGHARDYWVDIRPTFLDGSPVARKVPSAWTGALVSNELAVDIPAPAAANKKAAERATLLTKHIDTFRLTLQWHTTQGKLMEPGQSLQLTTVEADYKARPFWTIVVITKQRAWKIIDHLTAERFLERASDVKPAKSYPVPKLKSYSLTVRTSRGPHLYEHMPWGPNLLKRVEGLRKVMAGNRNAVRALDKILAPLKAMPAAGAPRPAASQPAKTARDVKVR